MCTQNICHKRAITKSKLLILKYYYVPIKIYFRTTLIFVKDICDLLIFFIWNYAQCCLLGICKTPDDFPSIDYEI